MLSGPPPPGRPPANQSFGGLTKGTPGLYIMTGSLPSLRRDVAPFAHNNRGSRRARLPAFFLLTLDR
jgi:hypothetical protein